MSDPNLLEYHLLSSCPFAGSISKLFGISTKIWVCPTLSVLRQRFLLGFIHRCLSATALTVAQIILRTPQNARPDVLRGFRYPTFCLLYGLSSSRVQTQLSYITTTYSGDSNQLQYNIKPSYRDGALNPNFR